MYNNVLDMVVDINKPRNYLNTEEGLLRQTEGSEKASWMR